MTTRVAAFGDGARFLMPSYEYIKGKNGLNALNRDHYTVRFGLAPSGGRLSRTEPRLRRVLALRASVLKPLAHPEPARSACGHA